MTARRRVSSQHGVTVLELAVVMFIIATLVAVAQASFLGDHQDRARDVESRQYLGTAYHLGKLVWREQNGYPPVGQPSDTASTASLIGQLEKSEPVLYWRLATAADDPRHIAVTSQHADIVTYASRSRSGRTFCLQIIERPTALTPSIRPGMYWSSGTGTIACGAPRALQEQGIPANGGSQGGQGPGEAWTETPLPLPLPIIVPDDARPYQNPGVLALTSFRAKNANIITGKLASNGAITIGNSSAIGAIEIGPASPEPVIGTGGGGQIADLERRPVEEGPWALAPVDVGLTAFRNDNDALEGMPGADYDPISRTLTVATGTTLTLPAGYYNFCQLNLGNNTTLLTGESGESRIYIDSPDRPGSDCPSGTGGVTSGNSVQFSNPSADATRFQMYLYGRNDGSSLWTIDNAGSFYGTLYAPQSKLVFNNTATVVGGIVARELEFKNSLDFTWAKELGELESTAPPPPYS